jgi:hypothetical protein
MQSKNIYASAATLLISLVLSTSVFANTDRKPALTSCKALVGDIEVVNSGPGPGNGGGSIKGVDSLNIVVCDLGGVIPTQVQGFVEGNGLSPSIVCNISDYAAYFGLLNSSTASTTYSGSGWTPLTISLSSPNPFGSYVYSCRLGADDILHNFIVTS